MARLQLRQNLPILSCLESNRPDGGNLSKLFGRTSVCQSQAGSDNDITYHFFAPICIQLQTGVNFNVFEVSCAELSNVSLRQAPDIAQVVDRFRRSIVHKP